MRIGSVGYATAQGLGVLAKAFYDNNVVTDYMVVLHGRRETHMEWYPRSLCVTSLRDPRQLKMMMDFCSKMDAMLFFETPFRWELIDHCRKQGVKTYLMPMYECMPQRLPSTPDEFLCPSLLDYQYYCDQPELVNTPVIPFSTCQGTHEKIARFTPVPVDVPWKLREKANVFVHNAGNGGLRNRNGTIDLVHALKFIRSPAQILIYTQCENLFNEIEPLVAKESSRVDVRLSFGTRLFNQLYVGGDVFVFPEKFNGLSLPLQEACASGMLVMGTDRFPMNTWLPREPLIPVSGYRTETVGGSCNTYQAAVVRPEDIAAKIDEWYGRDIAGLSLSGKSWAESMSWQVLGPMYQEVISK